MRINKKIFLLLILVIGVIVSLSYHRPESTKISDLPSCGSSNVKECAELTKQIEAIGAKKTYEEFKKKYENTPTEEKHGKGHLIGELLYMKLGLKGAQICDTDFNYGCYHGFFGVAIHKEGLEVIKKIGPYCDEGCQHGIGHGIVTAVGYDASDLPKELAVCKNSELSPTKLGCIGGVFMEFNTQSMLANFGRARPFDEKNALEPCLSIPGEYAPPCLYWLSQWWNISLNPPTASVAVEKEDSFCQNLSNLKQKSECYLGIGGFLPDIAGWNASNIIVLCTQIPTMDGRNNCKAGAARMFFADPKYRETSHNFCDSVKGEEKIECQQGVTNQINEAIKS